MNSPEITKTQDAFPAFLEPLSTLFVSTTADDFRPACAWMKLPLPDDCPSPGQARTWTRQDWSDWSKKNGFDWDGETAHSWTWKHRLANKLVVSVAKTPGDLRTPMAMATQTRRAVREFAMSCNSVLRDICRSGLNKDWQSLNEENFKASVIALIQNDSAEARDYLSKVLGKMVTQRSSKTVQDLLNVIHRVSSEFAIPPAKVMAQLTKDRQGDAILTWDHLKLVSPTADVPADFVETVKDYLEELREVDRAEKEQKKAEREKAEQERVQRQNEKNRPKTPREIFADQLAARDANTKKNFQAVISAAMSVLDRARMAEGHLSPIELPEMEDTAPLKKDLEQANRNLEDTKTALVAVTQSRQEALDKLAELTAKMTPERMKHLEDVEDTLSTFASMVVEAVSTAASANPFQMVGILNSLSDQAKTFVKKAG